MPTIRWYSKRPLIATYPNQEYTVPLNRCRKLRFESQGSGDARCGRLRHCRPGGLPRRTGRERPLCPSQTGLPAYGGPDRPRSAVHPLREPDEKTPPMRSSTTGSTQRKYFDLNGQRIYKGFYAPDQRTLLARPRRAFRYGRCRRRSARRCGGRLGIRRRRRGSGAERWWAAP